MGKPVSRIIAVGSSHGDDQVAWRVAERLEPQLGPCVVKLGSPLDLLDHLGECECLVILDACLGGGCAGTLTRLEWPNKHILVRHSHSSHGFGLVSVLELAEQLQRMPPKLVVLGIEIDARSATGSSNAHPASTLSEPLENALDDLAKQVLCEIQSHNRDSAVKDA